MGDEELSKIIAEAIQQVGAASERDKGQVMGKVMPQVKGRADGAQVNALLTELLKKAGGS